MSHDHNADSFNDPVVDGRAEEAPSPESSSRGDAECPPRRRKSTKRSGGQTADTGGGTRSAKDAREGRGETRREKARQRMYHGLIFEAAEEVFANKGFEASTMQDVATEAGVSMHTVYSVFDGKNELYAEIQRTRGEEFVGALGAPLETIDDPLEALERSVRAYVDFLADHPGFLRLHLREAKAWALQPADGPSEGVERVTQVVQRGIDLGVFHQGDAHMMALVGVAILQVWLGRMVELDDSDRESTVQEILQQLRRIYCIDPDGRRQAA